MPVQIFVEAYCCVKTDDEPNQRDIEAIEMGRVAHTIFMNSLFTSEKGLTLVGSSEKDFKLAEKN